MEVWDWKSFFSGSCKRLSGINKAHVFLLTKGADGQVEFTAKSWHQTTDWGTPETLFLSTVASGFPQLICPEELEGQILLDVTSICDVMFPTKPAVVQSFSALFTAHHNQIAKFKSESEPADFTWIETVQPPVSTAPDPVLANFVQDHMIRHTITLSKSSKTCSVFQKGDYWVVYDLVYILC